MAKKSRLEMLVEQLEKELDSLRDEIETELNDIDTEFSEFKKEYCKHKHNTGLGHTGTFQTSGVPTEYISKNEPVEVTWPPLFDTVCGKCKLCRSRDNVKSVACFDICEVCLNRIRGGIRW